MLGSSLQAFPMWKEESTDSATSVRTSEEREGDPRATSQTTTSSSASNRSSSVLSLSDRDAEESLKEDTSVTPIDVERQNAAERSHMNALRSEIISMTEKNSHVIELWNQFEVPQTQPETAEITAQRLELAKNITDALSKHINNTIWKAKQNMDFLIMLNCMEMETPGTAAFWAQNQGSDSADKCLILNETDVPFSLPTEEGYKNPVTFIPGITLANIKSTVRDENEENYKTPQRSPSSEENKLIRKLIHQAFMISYGYLGNENIKITIDTLLKTENEENPVTVKNIQSLFDKIEAELENSYPNNERNVIETAHLPRTYSEKEKKTIATFTKPANELQQSNALQQSKTVLETEVNPTRHLSQALYSSLKTVGATGGVGVSSIVGAAVGGIGGSAAGAIAGSKNVAHGLVTNLYNYSMSETLTELRTGRPRNLINRMTYYGLLYSGWAALTGNSILACGTAGASAVPARYYGWIGAGEGGEFIDNRFKSMASEALTLDRNTFANIQQVGQQVGM